MGPEPCRYDHNHWHRQPPGMSLGRQFPCAPACRRGGRHVAQPFHVPGLTRRLRRVTLTVLPFSQVLVLPPVQLRPPGTKMLMA